MGRVAELNLNGGTYTPCLISIDKNTNELVAVRQENVYIPNEVKGIKLTADEINALKEREAGICGRHDLKERKAVRRDAAIQCGTQGTGIYSTRKVRDSTSRAWEAYNFPQARSRCSAKGIPFLWKT